MFDVVDVFDVVMDLMSLMCLSVCMCVLCGEMFVWCMCFDLFPFGVIDCMCFM